MAMKNRTNGRTAARVGAQAVSNGSEGNADGLPPVLSREELLAELLPIVKGDDGEASSKDRIAAVGLYARIAGHMDSESKVVVNNGVDTGKIDFSRLLAAIPKNGTPKPDTP